MIRRLTTADASGGLLSDIRALLVAAFAGEFSDEDWQHTVGGWHVVVEEGGIVVSHAAVVPRVLHVGSRPVRAGYVEGVGTAPGWRRRGLASQVMGEVAGILRAGFEMGALSTGEIRLYARLGWEPWRGPTFVRDGDRLLRTEDEDGGVMVLRYGSSAGVDLDAPIACDARVGDDW